MFQRHTQRTEAFEYSKAVVRSVIGCFVLLTVWLAPTRRPSPLEHLIAALEWESPRRYQHEPPAFPQYVETECHDRCNGAQVSFAQWRHGIVMPGSATIAITGSCLPLRGSEMQQNILLTATESRQASPRRMNFRVLMVSMAALVGIAALLYIGVYTSSSPIGLPKQPSTVSEPAPR